MSGSHYAPQPESTRYDLRTVPEREADELAALRLEVVTAGRRAQLRQRARRRPGAPRQGAGGRGQPSRRRADGDSVARGAMTWQTTKTSADYTPAVAVWPNGRTQPCNVLAVRLDSVEAARKKLESGIVAWVRREDVSAVSLASEVARDAHE